MVDVYNLVDVLDSQDVIVFSPSRVRAMQPVHQPREDRFLEKSAFAGAGYTGDTNERTQREFHVDILQVMLPRASHLKGLPVRSAAPPRNGD